MNTKKILESIMADETKVEKVINAAAGVIVRIGDNNRPNVLLIQRASDDHWPLHWEFPRGKCDKPIGEDVIHCLKREVKEEVGLDIKPIEKIDVHEYLAEGGKRKTYCHNYLCMLKDPNQEIKLSKEHDSYKWISEIGEVELMVQPEQKKTLEKALNTERSIVSYPHRTSTQTVEEYCQYLNEDPFSGILKGGAHAVSGGAASAGGLAAKMASVPMLKIYFAAMIAKMAYEFYKSSFSKFARQCKDMPGREKTICMLTAKANAKKAQINKLKSGISKCIKARNPEKCKQALQNKVNQASAVMKLAIQRANQIGKQKY